MAELRPLHQNCEYGNSLDSMLRDHSVCGINHHHTQQRLLSEGADFSLQKVMGISLSVIKQTAAIQNEFNQPNEAISKIEQKTSSRNQSAKCFWCDNLHNPKLCPFIDKEFFFFFCKNKEHPSKVCRKKANSSLPIKHSSNEVSETILVENSEDGFFSIYWYLLQMSHY